MNKDQIAAERLYLTADKSKLVAEGDKAAAFLYAGKGDTIPESACERFGLVDGKLKAAKGGKPPSNKGGKTPANKEGSAPADKTTLASLTAIKGIGDATAGALVTAGIADAAALAAVDPENPPTVETLPPGFDWAAAVEAAKGVGE